MASIHAIDATQVQNARPPFSTDEVGAYLHYVATFYDDLLDGTFFVHGHVHGGLRPVIRAMDWTAKHGVAPQTWFGTTHAYDMAHDGPMPAHLGLHPEDLSRKRHGNYRNGEFFASRLSIRRRSVDFYRKAYATVVRDAKCADAYNGVTTRLPKPFEGYSDGSDCPQPRRYGPAVWKSTWRRVNGVEVDATILISTQVWGVRPHRGVLVGVFLRALRHAAARRGPATAVLLWGEQMCR